MEKKIKLNSDEIYYILEYLEDDYSTLYNFLTVNKLFCSLVVHFLWSNPFSKINKESIKIKIIYIYLSYLNDFEKKSIFCDFDSESLSKIPKTTMFNYASYLEFYSNRNIDSWIDTWYYLIHRINFRLNIKIKLAIKRMLLRSCKSIKYIDIFESVNYSRLLHSNNIYNVENISLSSNLSKLDFFFFSSKDKETFNQFIIKLSNQCKKILYMNVLVSGDSFTQELYDSLVKLIEAQIKLKEFGLRFKNRNYLTRPHIINLQSHVNSLKQLQLFEVDFTGFSFKNLKVLKNLEVLSIHVGVGSFEEEERNYYCESSEFFPNLKELELFNNRDVIDKKFIYLKLSSLKTLKYFNNHENECIARFVPIVGYYCSNLITLCCSKYKFEITSEIFKFQYLQQLQLGGCTYFPEDLITLAENLPISLKILNLLHIDSFDHIKFNNFIRKCNIKLIVLILPFDIKLNLLTELKNYIKKFKCLKKIIITSLYESNLNIKEMVDLFKEEGINYNIRNLMNITDLPNTFEDYLNF